MHENPAGVSAAARRGAWGFCALALLLGLLYPALLLLDRQTGIQSRGLLGLDAVVSLATTMAAGLIVARQPRNAIGWMLAFIGLSALATGDAQLYSLLANTVRAGTLPGGVVAAWLGSWLFFPGIALLVTLVPLLFPDGRLPSRRWRVVAWLSTIALVVATVGLAVGSVPRPAFRVDAQGVIETSSRLADTQGLGLFPFLLGMACLAALVTRLRRSRGEERQQMKWFVYGGLVYAAGLFINVATVLGPNTNNPPPWADAVQQVTSAAIPISIAVAVLKYRLYEIDVVISRTLVYTALAAFITLVYVAIVVGVGTLIGQGSRPNLGLSIIATAIVAVGFQPVRERLQKVANRLVYGERATPYEVLSEFSSRVAESYAADDVLPRMAKVLADGTGAEEAAVWLRQGEELRPAAMWPAALQNGAPPPAKRGEAGWGEMLPQLPDADRAVPVRHQGELLGALSVTKRRGESLTPIEEKLLDDLAHQAGLVLKNVGLTADLQARLEDLRESRRRLVAAQDQERRRLERNLHDGAQQHLVALKVKLGLAEMLAAKDPERAKATIAELKSDADEALETLRDLARGIYPPLLADKGLVAALEAQARKATLPVTVEAEDVGRYPQEVEAAVYFCVLEALQNVQKYAHATRVTVRLGEGPPPNPPPAGGGRTVYFAIEDDGRGFETNLAQRGAGLTNMQDRLDALGGSVDVRSSVGAGTSVEGRLPVAVPGIAHG